MAEDMEEEMEDDQHDMEAESSDGKLAQMLNNVDAPGADQQIHRGE